MIKQIGLPLRGRPILLITRMITDRIGLHSVLLPLLIRQRTLCVRDWSLRTIACALEWFVCFSQKILTCNRTSYRR